MSHGHYVQQDDNMLGHRVELRFTKREVGGLMHVYEEVIVSGGKVATITYPLDTDSGRERLAGHCVAPDMIPRR